MSSNHLHLRCDFREPSLSRALQEVRRLSGYSFHIDQLRSSHLETSLRELTESMGEDDLALICLLHAQPDQLEEAAGVLKSRSLDLRSRILLCSSAHAPEMRQWAETHRLRYEDNLYEAPRKAPWRPPSTFHTTSLGDRNWIQHRLMRALIAGESPRLCYQEILTTLKSGSLPESEIQRTERFIQQGEPDMAGGNYAEMRRKNPNAIDKLRDRAVQIGQSGLNTLIIGETGTGKESLAWYLHDFSTRCTRPFLPLNCAFFEGERLESELFGHEQGAFTDARKAKRGLVEEADGGTIFLDELPEMAPRVQAKLLRFLQDGSYTRLGGNQSFRADVRIVSAAQPGFLEKIRPDLLYRIADVRLETVPLRKMATRDLVNIACNLAYRLTWREVMREGRPEMITPEVVRKIWVRMLQSENASALARHDWPGNMRELFNLVRRFVLLGDDIFEELREKTGARKPAAGWGNDPLGKFLEPVSALEDLFVREIRVKELPGIYIRAVVDQLGGRERIQPTKLAQALGCSYNTLISCLGAEE